MVGALNPDGWTGDPTAGPTPLQLADDHIPLYKNKNILNKYSVSSVQIRTCDNISAAWRISQWGYGFSASVYDVVLLLCSGVQQDHSTSEIT